MRKKLATIILAVIMSVAFMPSVTFAAAAQNNNSTLENYKQALKEYVDDCYTDSVLDKSCYSSAVWVEIDGEYAAIMKIVDSATKVSDIVTDVSGMAMPSDQILDKVSVIEQLGSLSKQEVTGIGDLKRLVSSLKAKVKKKVAGYKKSNYNSYYWDIFKQKRDDTYSEIISAKSFAAYAEAKIDAEAYLLSDDGIIDKEGLEDDIDESWIYTKAELRIIRLQAVNSISSYVDEDLTAMGYRGDKDDEIYDELSKFYKRIDKIQDYEGINDAAEAELTKIAGIAEVNTANYEKATHADIIRMSKKLQTIYYNYKISNYTSAGWGKIEDIYDDYTSTLDNVYIAGQLKNMDTKMKARMDKVPTYKKELKTTKTKTIRALSKAKTASGGKWYHKRVVRLANKGIAKIRKCKTIAGVKHIYKAYKKKITKARKW